MSSSNWPVSAKWCMLTAIFDLFLRISSVVLIKHKLWSREEKLAKLLTIFSHSWEEFPLLLGLQISQEVVILLVCEHVQSFHRWVLGVAWSFKMLSLGWIVEACIGLLCHLFFFSHFHAIDEVLMSDIIFWILDVFHGFNSHEIYLWLIIFSSVIVQSIL